jgi:hypothetical protein
VHEDRFGLMLPTGVDGIQRQKKVAEFTLQVPSDGLLEPFFGMFNLILRVSTT